MRARHALALLCLCSAVPAAAQDVLTYHNSQARHGAYKVPGLTTSAAASVMLDRQFRGAVKGAVYAQPLYWHPKGGAAELIVATETNSVYALDPATGGVLWQTALPAPATPHQLGCGNIDPEGITGTPVIDPATGTLYLDALTGDSGAALQKIFALSLANGAILPGWPLDMQNSLSAKGISFSSAHQGERSALLLLSGKVYVVYGGRFGDCLPYKGTVAEIDPATKSLSAVWQTRASGAGIWSLGGIASDNASLFVATGNSFNASTYGDGESIVRLKQGLAAPSRSKDYYAPANWSALDAQDADLGGTEALPVNIADRAGKPTPAIVAFGKDGNAYLLNRNNLGGVGGPATIVRVSNTRIITAPAIYATATGDSVAITNESPAGCAKPGIMMLHLAPGGASPISVAWCAAYDGNGAPIVTTTDGTTNPIVWVVGAEGDNRLHGFDALTGATIFGGGPALENLRHFATITAAEGRLFVAADNRIYAFTFTKG